RIGAREGVQQEPDGDHRDEDGRGDDADRDVALGDRQRVARAALALAVVRDRGPDSADDRAKDPQQRPDGRDADGPGADEADLVDEYVADEIVEAGAERNGAGERGVMRYQV